LFGYDRNHSLGLLSSLFADIPARVAHAVQPILICR
jgi:hypothetical protein